MFRFPLSWSRDNLLAVERFSLISLDEKRRFRMQFRFLDIKKREGRKVSCISTSGAFKNREEGVDCKI